MRIFVSEYVCGGAWLEETLPESLSSEGRAMLLALLEDAARVSEWEVCTTWDRRLGEFPQPGINAMIVDGPAAERAAFDRLARECDATYVIAPELDNLLASRCQRVAEVRGKSLNSSIDAIELCSDKLRLARRFDELQVPTLPTEEFDSASAESRDYPVVVKPQFGAGSQEMYLVESPRRFEELQSSFPDKPVWRQGIVQPFVKGLPVSVVAFLDDQGQVTDMGPVVEQLLSANGRFTYLGGRISKGMVGEDEVRRVAVDAVSAAPGLCGYVGIDLLVPHQRPPLVVEINPRLTTSYIGCRALTAENLAERVLQFDRPRDPVAWTRGDLLFTSHGSVRITSRNGKTGELT